MEIDFFKNQIQRLRQTYGSGAYPSEVARVIWDRVAHIKPDRFQKAIDYCLAENPKYAFGIDKIEVALSHIREEKHEAEKKERNKNAPSMDEIARAVREIRESL